ncbi:MAG: hypothetical protein RI909_659 [Bacteroidota bacterium]|jgi:predicted GNAT family acetyltransferase
MPLELKAVNSKALLKEYIYLCQHIYRNETRWVPPFYEDEWAFHDPTKNKTLEHCETMCMLLYKEGKAVGRIMGIIHHPYNQNHQEKTARFFNLDCINDQEVAHTLIQSVETWALSKGMTKVIGPFGFSDKDPQGLQIEGLEYLPVLATPANPAYLPNLIAAEGYAKEVDCVSYQMPIPKEVPPLYTRVSDRIKRNNSLHLIEFKSKRALKPYIIPVLRLVNETYAPLFGFAPMSEAEMKKFADQYVPVLDPEFVKVVANIHNDVIAFVVAMPDMSAGIQKARGKLFPFGFIYVLNSMRKSKQLNLMLGAVKNGHRGNGISAMMGKSMIESANKRGLEIMDSHLILEHNYSMRGECEKLNGTVCKRFRIFSKTLL